MYKIILAVFISSGSLFCSVETFEREYTYQASEYDSKITSRANALDQVKRILLEEIAVFLKSDFNSVTKLIGTNDNYALEEFDEHKITSITAGVTETKILDERWDGATYWIKAEITINKKEIYDQIDQIISSKEELKEFEKIKKEAENSIAEIARLKVELSNAQSNNQKLKLQESYKNEIDGLSARDLFYKAKKASSDGKTEDAINYMIESIKLKPHYISLASLGTYYKKNGNYKRALESLNKALDLGRGNHIIFAHIANIYNEQGNYNKAVEYYLKAIDRNSNIGYLYYNLANIYYRQGDYSKCIDNYYKNIELNPNEYKPYINLGLAYLKQGNYSSSIENIEKGIILEPNYAKNYFSLGNAYEKKGDLIKAISAYENAIELDKNYSKPYRGLGLIRSKQGKSDLAKELFQKAYELGDTSLKGYLEYDKIHKESKNFVQTGWDYYENEDYDNANLYFLKAIELSPNYGLAHYMLGVTIHYRSNDFKKALLHYQKAAKLGNQDAQKYLTRNGYDW